MLGLNSLDLILKTLMLFLKKLPKLLNLLRKIEGNLVKSIKVF